MRKIVAKLIAFAVAFTAIFSAARQNALADGQSVRVALSIGSVTKISVTLSGAYRIGDKTVQDGTLTAQVQNGTVTLSHSAAGTVSSDVQVLIVSESADNRFSLSNSRYGLCSYRGDLCLGVTQQGYLEAINQVGMLDYLCGTVAAAVQMDTPEEAIKAQAVAIKGLTLTSLNPSAASDVTDTSLHQIYTGIPNDGDMVYAAVQAVTDQTLSDNGLPVKTYFCIANGGQTLTPAMRWGETAQTGVFDMRYDPYDLAGASDALVLRLTTNPADMPEALYASFLEAARAQNPSIAALTGLSAMEGYFSADSRTGTDTAPNERAPQERAVAIFQAATEDGLNAQTEITFSLYALMEQGAVSASNANVWYVHPVQSDGVWELVYARSDGHRVGMSQRGMIEMAKQGFSYADILAFYYPGAALTTDPVIEAPAPSTEPAHTDETPETVQPGETAGDITAQPDTNVTPEQPEEMPEMTIVVTEPTASPTQQQTQNRTLWQILFGWLFGN